MHTQLLFREHAQPITWAFQLDLRDRRTNRSLLADSIDIDSVEHPYLINVEIWNVWQRVVSLSVYCVAISHSLRIGIHEALATRPPTYELPSAVFKFTLRVECKQSVYSNQIIIIITINRFDEWEWVYRQRQQRRTVIIHCSILLHRLFYSSGTYYRFQVSHVSIYLYTYFLRSGGYINLILFLFVYIVSFRMIGSLNVCWMWKKEINKLNLLLMHGFNCKNVSFASTKSRW